MGGGVGWGGVGQGGVVWCGVVWCGVGGGKNYHLEYSMSSRDTHTVVNDTPVGHIASGSKSRSPLSNWHPPWVPLFQL